jgi:hypothetical protein
VRLHRAPGHLELSGNLRIVATLEQQFGNLLFPRTQPNRAFVHSGFPLGLCIQGPIRAVVDRSSMCPKPRAASESLTYSSDFLISPKIHSMHTAKLTVDFHFQRKMIFLPVSWVYPASLLILEHNVVICFRIMDIKCSIFADEPSPQRGAWQESQPDDPFVQRIFRRS